MEPNPSNPQQVVATDKQKLVKAIATHANAHKSGDAALIKFATQYVNQALNTLPDNWTVAEPPKEA